MENPYILLKTATTTTVDFKCSQCICSEVQESKISVYLYQVFTEYRRNTRKKIVISHFALMLLCPLQTVFKPPQVISKTIYLRKMFGSSACITYRVGLLVCKFSTRGGRMEDGLRPQLCTLPSFGRTNRHTLAAIATLSGYLLFSQNEQAAVSAVSRVNKESPC